MSALNSLKLVVAKRPSAAAPPQLRRLKLSKQLTEQLRLAEAEALGMPYRATRTRMVLDSVSGERVQREVPKRVRAWWFGLENGRLGFQVRYGTGRVLELGNGGKNSVEVASITELAAAIATVKSAVDSGELDAQIELASAGVRERFVK